MKSLIYQGVTPLVEPSGCGAIPCRTEVPIRIKRGSRVYNFILRDKVIPEDPYLILVKAIAFSIQQREPYVGRPPDRGVRDFLIKNTVII